MLLLRDLLEVNVQGIVNLYAMDEHDNAVDSRTVVMDGESMPRPFADFADCRVRYVFPQDGGISVEVDAPADTEIYYTGGGIDCAVHKLPDGTWFSGATNEFGGVYATRGQAVESFDGEDGFIRYVEDLEEQKSIWRDIYLREIERGGSYAEDCERWLKTLDADLESMWAG